MKRISIHLMILVSLSLLGSGDAFAQDAAPVVEAEALAPLDNLDFASGEIVAFDAASGKLDVKVYLDGAGDAKDQTISLAVGSTTEITSGENDLKPDSLKTGAEIDVEYDTKSNKATYIFIY